MHLILVGYSPAATRRSLALCDQVFSGLAIGRKLRVWNGPRDAEDAVPAGWERLVGSNRLAEFSGWQEGLDSLGKDTGETVIFVNDTLGSHRHPSVVRRWALRRELRRAGTTGVVGFSDLGSMPPGALAIDGLGLDGWVSTFCFSLPSSMLRRLGGRIFDLVEVERCVPGGSDPKTFFSDRISPDLQRHLRWWLFEGGWYRSAPLRDENARVLTLKARCISAELLLSAKARALGYPLRDPMRGHPLTRWLEAVHGKLYRLVSALRRHRQEPIGAGR